MSEILKEQFESVFNTETVLADVDEILSDQGCRGLEDIEFTETDIETSIKQIPQKIVIRPRWSISYPTETVCRCTQQTTIYSVEGITKCWKTTQIYEKQYSNTSIQKRRQKFS